MLNHLEISQAVLFGFVMVSCWLVESSMTLVDAGRRHARVLANALFAASAFPVQVVAAAFCIGVSHWAQARHLGLYSRMPGPDWLRYGILFVVLDLLDYVYHVLMHRVPLFWRFHAVHHTDDDVDVSTTVREHPGETAIRNGFLALWTVLTGAPLELLAIRQVVETISNIVSHTSIPFDAFATRCLGSVFITPDLHRVHHHRLLPFTDRNYGDVFSLWDRMFGTMAHLDRSDIAFGLDTYRDASERGFEAAIVLPFVFKQGPTAHRGQIGGLGPEGDDEWTTVLEPAPHRPELARLLPASQLE